MRALLQSDYASPVLEHGTLPVPVPRPNTSEHLIRVIATAPCADELTWFHTSPSHIGDDKQPVPCFDLSGEVVVAPVDSPFQPGAKVWTSIPGERTGAAAEYTIAKTSELAEVPESVDLVSAASVPLSAFTAYQALFEFGGLVVGWKDAAAAAQNAKRRIIVTAAAGGVGVWVLQLARAAGVKDIVAVCGSKNVEFVKELGATEVVNYRVKSLADWAAENGEKKADLIIDMVGGETLAGGWRAVKDGGVVISVHSHPEKVKPFEDVPKDVRSVYFIKRELGWQLKEVGELIAQGKAKAFVDSVFDFENSQKAFDKLAQGHARGKVVIKIQ